MLSIEEASIIIAFLRHPLLPLDDCLYTLQPTIPHLTRSSLRRCLQRHGISGLPDVTGNKSGKKKYKTYRSATSISTLLRCRPPRANCTFTLPLIARDNLPCPGRQED